MSNILLRLLDKGARSLGPNDQGPGAFPGFGETPESFLDSRQRDIQRLPWKNGALNGAALGETQRQLAAQLVAHGLVDHLTENGQDAYVPFADGAPRHARMRDIIVKACGSTRGR
jgi:hypothetical protein